MTSTDTPGPVTAEMTTDVIDRLARVMATDPGTEIAVWEGGPGETGISLVSKTTGTSLFRRVIAGEEELIGWGAGPTVYRFPGPDLSGNAQAVAAGISERWAFVSAVFPAVAEGPKEWTA